MAITYRLAYGGAIGTEETWQNTIHLQAPNTGLAITDQEWLEQTMNDLKGWFAGMNFAANTDLRWAKFNQIDPATGHYVSKDATNIVELTTPTKGKSSQGVPPNLSLCVTLTTASKRGIASKGRIFLPPLNIGFEPATGRIMTSEVNNAVASMKSFLQAINNPGGIVGTSDAPRVVVLGRGGVVKPVTGLKIGNVMDTQRRRRKSMKEVYAEGTL